MKMQTRKELLYEVNIAFNRIEDKVKMALDLIEDEDYDLNKCAELLKLVLEELQ
jgi:hypothetical protein